ncbi:MAG: hypothetical protein HOG49_15120 [Candidatus Scalindua sp.]|nr:hypothetical protein [Candidatus Scalindua sp.]
MEKITDYIQDSIIALLLQDKNFLTLCRTSISTDLFDGMIRKDLCSMLYSYYDEFKEAPKDDFRDYIKLSKERDKEAKLYRLYLKKLKGISLNKKYIVSQLIEWIQYQQLTGAVLKSAELIKDRKYKEIKQTILEAFNTELSVYDIGEDFWDFVYTGEDDLEVVCKTGIETIDNKIHGYCRSELFLWLGATNVGKSWALTDGARAALLQGKNVVIYSLEMIAKNYQKRLAMAISGMKRDFTNGDLLITFADGTSHNFKENEVLCTDSETFKKSKEFYKRRNGRVIIKEGIEGKFTVGAIHAHLNQLEISGFAPDIIFVDYADLLGSDRKFKEKIHEIDDVFTNLRGLAKERNIAVVSATQGTRDAIDARRVGLRQTSGSIGKAKIADVVLTLNQTEEEAKGNIMRLFAAKVREGHKYWSVSMSQALEVGAFCLDDTEILDIEED